MRWFRNSPTSLLAWALVFFAVSLYAEPPDLARFAGRVRVGAEIEFAPYQFALIVGNFDLTTWQPHFKKLRLSDQWVDTYLEVPGAFESLPAPVRASLGEGLFLKVELETVAPKSIIGDNSKKLEDTTLSVKGLLGPDGKPYSSEIVPSDLVTSKATQASKQGEANIVDRGGFVLTPAGALERDRAVLVTRWKALPLLQRRKLMRLEHLSPLFRATFVINYLRTHPGTKLEMKRGIPIGIQNILQDYNWSVHPQQQLIEFRHTDPYLNPAEMEESRRKLALLANTNRGFNDMNIPPEGGVTFHFHASLVEDRDLKNVAHSYNQLLLSQLGAAGRIDSVLRPGRVAFSALGRKGLIRLIGNNRIEQRVHLKDPAESLAELLSLMVMPEDQVIGKINAEIRKNLTPDVLDAIGERNLSLLNEILSDSYDGKESGAEPERVILIQKAVWRRLVDKKNNPAQKLKALSTLEEFYRRIPGALQAIEEFSGQIQAEFLRENGAAMIAGLKNGDFREESLSHAIVNYIFDLGNDPNGKFNPYFLTKEFGVLLSEYLAMIGPNRSEVTTYAFSFLAQRSAEIKKEWFKAIAAHRVFVSPTSWSSHLEDGSLKEPSPARDQFLAMMRGEYGPQQSSDCLEIYVSHSPVDAEFEAAFAYGFKGKGGTFGDSLQRSLMRRLYVIATGEKVKNRTPEELEALVARASLGLKSSYLAAQDMAIAALVALSEHQAPESRSALAALDPVFKSESMLAMLAQTLKPKQEATVGRIVLQYAKKKFGSVVVRKILETARPPRSCQRSLYDLGA